MLLGRCDEEVGAPYRPFHEALSHLVAHADEELLRTHVASHGGELARMVPALGQRLGELPPPQTTDPDTERYLLYAAVVGLLEEASRQRPVVLLLDDLHWADKPSLQLLRHVVANTSASPSADPRDLSRRGALCRPPAHRSPGHPASGADGRLAPPSEGPRGHRGHRLHGVGRRARARRRRGGTGPSALPGDRRQPLLRGRGAAQPVGVR